MDSEALDSKLNLSLSCAELLACPSSPCLNGATCFEKFDSDGYLCACLPGFEGDMCETGKFIIFCVFFFNIRVDNR